MPNGPAFEDALQIAAATPELDVGIHLVLVDGPCVASPEKVRRLMDSAGYLPRSYGAFLLGFLAGRFGLKEIRSEIEAQVKRVCAAGVSPTHLDSHQHLHILPGIIDIVLETARAAGIPFIRLPRERGWIGPRFGQRQALRLLCRNAVSKMIRARMRFADHFFGFSTSGHLNEKNLTKILLSLGEGVNEIMTHPGFRDPATEERYPWHYQWDVEGVALQSERVRRLIDEQGILLASFRDTWNGTCG